MIIVRSPFRLSLGGGGTDQPSYYQQFGGYFVSATINKYMYITIHKTFEPKLLLRYSRLELVDTVDEIKHPIIREVLRYLDFDVNYLEMVSIADVPAQTGLGSSGSFTVALLQALQLMQNKQVTSAQLAEQACAVEIDILQEPIGKQDQYAAAFGGFNTYTIDCDGKVTVTALQLTDETKTRLANNCLLFFTGMMRKSSSVLLDQVIRTKQQDKVVVENLHETKRIGLEVTKALEQGDLAYFADLMNQHWQCKRNRCDNMTNSHIDDLYDLGIKSGALGGKLIGAGNGGFLMFYTEQPERLRLAMQQKGVHELAFSFEDTGSQVIYQS